MCFCRGRCGPRCRSCGYAKRESACSILARWWEMVMAGGKGAGFGVQGSAGEAGTRGQGDRGQETENGASLFGFFGEGDDAGGASWTDFGDVEVSRPEDVTALELVAD